MMSRKYVFIAPVLLGLFMLFVISAGLFFADGEQIHSFCANSISCLSDMDGEKEANNEGFFMGERVTAPTLSKATSTGKRTRQVLGTQTSENKHLSVDLSSQQLYAYEGKTLIYVFPVSTGKWNYTPTGEFHIWSWLKYARMTGGNETLGTYYDLPNVPFTMYYYNEHIPKMWGYSLNGAYWHDNFGKPMTHGGIDLKVADAEKIFYWSNESIQDEPKSLGAKQIRLTIYGSTPKE